MQTPYEEFMKKLIAGNWKMNGSADSARNLVKEILAGISEDKSLLDRNDFTVCPSFVHITLVKKEIAKGGLPVTFGGQDCAVTEDGAFTGDISASMLKDLGCEYVILGHSERRQYHKESNTLVADKAALAHKHGLKTIICIGETESEREAGKEKEVVGRQFDESLPESSNSENTVIAYEPVWAIGTGKTATPDDVAEMHSFIRGKLADRFENPTLTRILYGGSVKPENAAELFAVDNVDGALIGGASLKSGQYLAIAKAS
jgi:triosephosphate isomerase